MMHNEDLKYYYNLETHQVEQGKISSYDNRIGPYDTREEADHALEIAKERNRVAGGLKTLICLGDRGHGGRIVLHDVPA